MEFKKDHQFLGLEFDWLASDQIGLVGYFSTAGQGPVPVPVLDRADFFSNLNESLKGLPESCNYNLLRKWEHDITDWISVARRGVFAYDWNFEYSCYELVAVPTKPIFKNLLPLEIIKQMETVLLPVEFNSAEIYLKF